MSLILKRLKNSGCSESVIAVDLREVAREVLLAKDKEDKRTREDVIIDKLISEYDLLSKLSRVVKEDALCKFNEITSIYMTMEHHEQLFLLDLGVLRASLLHTLRESGFSDIPLNKSGGLKFRTALVNALNCTDEFISTAIEFSEYVEEYTITIQSAYLTNTDSVDIDDVFSAARRLENSGYRVCGIDKDACVSCWLINDYKFVIAETENSAREIAIKLIDSVDSVKWLINGKRKQSSILS